MSIFSGRDDTGRKFTLNGSAWGSATSAAIAAGGEGRGVFFSVFGSVTGGGGGAFDCRGRGAFPASMNSGGGGGGQIWRSVFCIASSDTVIGTGSERS